MEGARQNYLLEQITRRGFATPAELGKEVGASAVTIRRDLGRMEAAGLIRRVHGGAVPAGAAEQGRHLSTRMRREPLAKRAIGAFAASLVQPGETIFLDAGSTCLCVAEALAENSNLTVITHSLAAINCLQHRKGIRLIAVGGQLDEGLSAFLGQTAENNLQSFWADRAFIGAAGLHPVRGCVNDNLVEGKIKSLLRTHAQHPYHVADASKFITSAFCTITPVEQIGAIITDASLPKATAQHYLDCGVVVHIAPALKHRNTEERS